MTARFGLKLIAFACYVPALVLALTSLFLPWVTIENVGRMETGMDVSPLVPVLVAVLAVFATIVGKSRGMRRLAPWSHVALGALAVLTASEAWRQARLGQAAWFDVDLTTARIRPEAGLAAFALSGVLLILSGLIEALRPHGR